MGGQYRYVSYYHGDGGRLWRLTHPDGANFYYGYDGLGRMTAVLENPNIASIDDYVIRYWYKPEGPRHAAVRGAGTAGFTTISYYDSLQRPTVLADDFPAAADMVVELPYNPASQIVSRSVGNDAYAWTGAYNVSRSYAVNGPARAGRGDLRGRRRIRSGL
jgi:YD repeat-containing protein